MKAGFASRAFKNLMERFILPHHTLKAEDVNYNICDKYFKFISWIVICGGLHYAQTKTKSTVIEFLYGYGVLLIDMWVVRLFLSPIAYYCDPKNAWTVTSSIVLFVVVYIFLDSAWGIPALLTMLLQGR